MRRFAWLPFLEQRHIPYTTTGSNVAKNHVNIACPMCRDDPSHHMGLCLDPRKPYWGCWRNTSHRGKSPVYLVAKLLRISRHAAALICGAGQSYDVEDFTAAISRLRDGAAPAPSREAHSALVGRLAASLPAPRGVLPLRLETAAKPYLSYLRRRGFFMPATTARDFDLRYAVTGLFARRLIFPVYQDGAVRNYVGRDVSGASHLRYRNLSNDASAEDLSRLIYGHDELVLGGETLFIVEGPFDALKLNAYLPRDCFSVALFGKPKIGQTALLARHADLWRRVVLLLDRDAYGSALRLQSELARPHVRVFSSLPTKDPGDLTPLQVRALARSVG
jgi:hypothetical protein